MKLAFVLIYSAALWAQSEVGEQVVRGRVNEGLWLRRTSATVATLGPNCSATYPCSVVVGTTRTEFTNSASVTLTAGTGTVFFYVSSGARTVGYTGTIAVTTSNVTDAGVISAFPASSIPLWRCVVSSAATWPTTCEDFRSTARRDILAAGTNIELVTGVDGVVTVNSTASGGGVTPSIRNTIANIEATTCNSSISGQVAFPTNGVRELLAQCNGSSWQWFFQNIPITRPSAAAGWSSAGGGTFTVADSGGGVRLDVTAPDLNNGQAFMKAAPGATPWTKTLAVFNNEGVVNISSSGPRCGVAFFDGTTTAANFAKIGAGYRSGSGTNVTEVEWGSDFSGGGGSVVTTINNPEYGLVWYQLTDDGTNLVFRKSVDGLNFRQVYTATRATLGVTPTHYGVMCSIPGATTHTYNALLIADF